MPEDTVRCLRLNNGDIIVAMGEDCAAIVHSQCSDRMGLVLVPDSTFKPIAKTQKARVELLGERVYTFQNKVEAIGNRLSSVEDFLKDKPSMVKRLTDDVHAISIRLSYIEDWLKKQEKNNA